MPVSSHKSEGSQPERIRSLTDIQGLGALGVTEETAGGPHPTRIPHPSDVPGEQGTNAEKATGRGEKRNANNMKCMLPLLKKKKKSTSE